MLLERGRQYVLGFMRDNWLWFLSVLCFLILLRCFIKKLLNNSPGDQQIQVAHLVVQVTPLVASPVCPLVGPPILSIRTRGYYKLGLVGLGEALDIGLARLLNQRTKLGCCFFLMI